MSQLGNETTERAYQPTGDVVFSTLLQTEDYRWFALIIMRKMMHDNVQPVYVSNASPTEEIVHLKEKIKLRFPTFSGFDDLYSFLMILRNAGMKRLDLDHLPEEAQFIRRFLGDVRDDGSSRG